MTERRSDNRPTPLTQEQLRQIEETNKLLGFFSQSIEELHKQNPNVQFPTNLLYNFFLLGAAAVQKETQAVTMGVAKEVNEMKLVLFTYMEAMKAEQPNGEQP